MDKINFILENLNINLSQQELIDLQNKFTQENISFINSNFTKYIDLIINLKNLDVRLSEINNELNSPIINQLAKNISKLQILLFIYISSQQFDIPNYHDILTTLNILNKDILNQYNILDDSLKTQTSLLLEELLQNFKILQDNIIIKNNVPENITRNKLLQFIIKNGRLPNNKGNLNITQEEFQQILFQIQNDLEKLDKQFCIRKKNYCNQYKGDKCNTDPNCVYVNFTCQPIELRCRNIISRENYKKVLKEKAERLLYKIKYYKKYLKYKQKYLFYKK